jgi:membrane protease subunit HflK
MKNDYLTYKRAANVSVWGLVLQAVLAATLLIYGILGRDNAALAGSVFAGMGILAWLSLVIVYDQHRRERVESMEADALSASPLAGTSAFSGAADDFRPAARRLAVLHKFFVPAVSIVILLTLGLSGVAWFFNALDKAPPLDFVPPRHMGWGLGLGLSIAVIGFVFARYAAGMAKHPAWANLRGGAAFAVGAAVIGLIIAVANFVDLIGPDIINRYAPVAVACFMVLIGVEILLHFLLALYRPRKGGEIPRPAFDSRLLGLLAAPDRIAQSISEAINYQLGFDVTSGWFYQLLSRAMVPLIIMGVGILWLLSAVVIVQPHQRALILRFGDVVREDVPPGMHFKMPWPIDSVYIPEFLVRDKNGRLRVADHTVTGLRTVELGTLPTAVIGPILWTNDHGGEELYQLVRTSLTPGPMGTDGIGEQLDLSLVSVELPMNYIINDVRAFDELGAAHQRDEILKALAQRVVLRFFRGVTLDDVLGGRRVELSGQLHRLVQEAFDAVNPGPDGTPRGAGVQVVSLAITGVHPPRETAIAFETPVQADQKREANIESAQARAIRSLTEVVGDTTLGRNIVDELSILDTMRTRGDNTAAVREQELKIEGLLERAGGSSAALLAKARADRWTRHMRARGDAARHQGRMALFDAAPDVFRANQYFTTLREVMRNARVYITPEHNFLLDFENKDKDFGQDVFRNFTTGDGIE